MYRILVIIATLILTSSLHAQPRFGLSEEDYAIALRWLRTDCLAPEAKSLLDLLVSRRVAMQQAFTRALAEGPTAEEVAAVRSSGAARWRAQREFIDRPEVREALPADQWQALRNQTEDGVIRSEVDNFVSGYKSNAMAGLAVVGDDNALAQLRDLAGKGGPDAIAARGALAYRESLTTR
jgi:hypothetical protein